MLDVHLHAPQYARPHTCRLAFIAAASDNQYAAVLIDVVANDAEDGAPLEFPPASFVSEVFLEKHVARVTRPGGMIAMNVIGDVRKTYARVRGLCIFKRCAVL